MKKILTILLIFFVLAWGSSVFADPPRRTLDTENMPSTTYQDDTALIFGTDGDFHFEYNSTTGLWQWSDGNNIFFTLRDKGTTGIFDFYDEIDLHRTAGSGAGVAYHGLGIEMQVGALNAASLMHGINFTVVGDTNGEVSAIGTNGPISPIHQHVGTLGNMGWGSIYTASAHTDKTTAFNTSGAPSATLTDAVNDYFLIADAGTFEQISIELLIHASLDQWLTFEYGDGSQAWVEFTPFDGTDGLTKDGLVTWSTADLTSWGTDTVNEITGKSGSADLYWIKITRTRPGNPTDPIENHIQILSPTTYEWDENGDLNVRNIRSRFNQVDKSADAVTLTALEVSDTLVTNRGWDGNDDQTFTLADADTSVGAGLKFKFLALVASSSTADTYFDTEGSTTKIYLNGTPGTDGHRIWIQEISIGDSLVCHTATLDGTTYDWFCDSINGTVLNKGN